MVKRSIACTGETVFRHAAHKAVIHERTKFFLYKKNPGFFFVSVYFLAVLYMQPHQIPRDPRTKKSDSNASAAPPNMPPADSHLNFPRMSFSGLSDM